jgi:hypothetical protein
MPPRFDHPGYPLLVNLQTAKMLGVDVPLSMLIRADELLE